MTSFCVHAPHSFSQTRLHPPKRAVDGPNVWHDSGTSSNPWSGGHRGAVQLPECMRDASTTMDTRSQCCVFAAMPSQARQRLDYGRPRAEDVEKTKQPRLTSRRAGRGCTTFPSVKAYRRSQLRWPRADATPDRLHSLSHAHEPCACDSKARAIHWHRYSSQRMRQ